jgi:hypothetical protein
MRYKSATALMDRLEPFIALYNSGGDTDIPRKVRTVGAVAAMNHLKRLERAGLSSAEQHRLELQFRAFAALAEAGIATLHGKHISLALNAVGHRTGHAPLFAAAAPRLRALCRRCLSCGGQSGGGVCARCPLDGRSVALSLNALSKAAATFRDDALLADLANVAASMAHADTLEVAARRPRGARAARLGAGAA